MTQRATSSVDSRFRQRLTTIVGSSGVLDEPSECWAYGFDNSRRHALPGAVVFPSDHDQVRELLQICNESNVPVLARGRGTGTTGATVPIHGGIVLAMERMDRVVNVDPANRVLVVQPGATNQQVQETAAGHGFFWPPDPTSAAYCTIGGNLAYNSAGPRAVKYGTPRENTLGLRAVTGGGRDLRTGVYTTKSVVGYDLTRLIIGSEGTLAVITEATLKLTPIAEGKRTLQAVYRDVHAAAEAVARIMAGPAIPCALEFMDGSALEMIRGYSDADLPDAAGALLMIEVDGPHACLDALAGTLQDLAQGEGAIEVRRATSIREVEELWRTRKALSPALRKVAPKKINEDVVVPVSKIPELIDGLEGLSQELGIKIVNFGHAGNGNIHVNLLVNPEDPTQMRNAQACLDRVFDLVLSLDGSLSGEHGVGLEKRDFVGRELDPEALAIMHGIKEQFDPRGILNPGKMFPSAGQDPDCS